MNMPDIHTPSIVRVTVSNSLTSFVSERRFDRGLPIPEIKGKLELMTGCMSQSMQLEVYSKEDKLLFKIGDTEELLGSFAIDDGMRIHVIDTNPQQTDFTDVSQCEKYNMPDENYNSKRDTVRSFLKNNKKGRFDPKNMEQSKLMKEKLLQEEEEAMQKIHVGDRCEVSTPGQLVRRGCVKFIGYTEFKPNLWVGVAYDEPHGKNDGSVEGKRYFTCEPKYGAFVRPKVVQVGDFPELDIFDGDDEM
uniref:Tubulin-folding cofactor B n=1 Tax=Ciona intestinalis TaxID=7719 RepID=H2Y184_CIOIN|nr:tubulin-folding cofactor B [Ciona intestinalis]|eukprot:XP_002119217.1 tubulin-folding cofactor B [Ciona intestinalis]